MQLTGVALFATHAVAVSASGSVFTWGNASGGRLGYTPADAVDATTTSDWPEVHRDKSGSSGNANASNAGPAGGSGNGVADNPVSSGPAFVKTPRLVPGLATKVNDAINVAVRVIIVNQQGLSCVDFSSCRVHEH